MQNFVVVSFLLLLLTNCRFVQKWPDAIRCSSRGHIFFPHAVHQTESATYCNVFASQNRCVVFNNQNGAYLAGYGNQEVRNYCTGKSISELQKSGRTFNLDNSAQIQKLTDRINNLETKQAANPPCSQKNTQMSLIEYQQLKQKMYGEFQSRLLNQIKKNGLYLGSRWVIREQGDVYVVRDYIGTKSKDSRLAFYPNRYRDV